VEELVVVVVVVVVAAAASAGDDGTSAVVVATSVVVGTLAVLVRLSFVDVGLKSFLVLFVDFASAIVVVAVAIVVVELVVAVATVLFLFLPRGRFQSHKFLSPLPSRAIEFPPANSPECPSPPHVSLKTPVKKHFASNSTTYYANHDLCAGAKCPKYFHQSKILLPPTGLYRTF